MRSLGIALATSALAATLSSLLTIWALQLGAVDWTIPLHYQGDALLPMACAKGMMEHGWYLFNESLGAPYGMELHDFPQCDNLHLFSLKLLTYLVNPFAACNLYYFLTFPLTTLSSLLVFKQFRISYGAALPASLLYSFLPYHLARNLTHLYLASYYLVPLMVMVVLWIFLTPDDLWQQNTRPGARRYPSRRGWLATLICVLVSSAGVYYAFFGCFFLVIAGLAAAWRSRRLLPIASAAGLAGVTVLGVAANLAPNLIYAYQHGWSQERVMREPWESEVYGLKLAQLVLPISDHRCPALAELKRSYDGVDKPGHTVNEGNTCALGIIGAAGFLFLLGRFFWRRSAGGQPDLQGTLAVLTVWGFALATVGGLGVLFALLCTPWIRGYNRLSVYLAFFAFTALALLLDRAWQRCTSFRGRVLVGSAAALLCTLGHLDQTNGRGYCLPERDELQREFASDAAFVRDIEELLPDGARVFQLPYLPFVEHMAPAHMHGYDHLVCYLHSRHLRWSYGAAKGRLPGLWYEQAAERPVPDMIKQLCLAGFSGIAIDRAGYHEAHLAALETGLAELLGGSPLVSEDQRRSFFSLTEYGCQLRQRYSAAQWQELHECALHPIALLWRGGFGKLESSMQASWRWCSANGELQIHNISKRPRAVRLRLELRTDHDEASLLTVEGNLLHTQVALNKNAGVLDCSFTTPPGKQVLHLYCNARRVDPDKDPRDLVFCVTQCEMTEITNLGHEDSTFPR